MATDQQVYIHKNRNHSFDKKKKFHWLHQT